MSEQLGRVCLSGEGRGRLEHSKGRQLFEFESLLEKEKKKWSLGLDLPVIGQELLYFNYPKIGESKTRVEGTFATRLKMDISSGPNKVELNNFFLMMGELLSMIDSRKLRDDWRLPKDSSRFILEKPLSEESVFRFEATGGGPYFERLSLNLLRRDKFKRLKRSMKLDLFLSQCSM